MTFAEALVFVNPYIENFEQYKVVSKANAEKLLGEAYYSKLTDDPIRGVGPNGSNAYYYWNVVDYLMLANKDAWRQTNANTVKPSEALRSWLQEIDLAAKQGKRIAAQCPPVSIAIVFFETGRVKEGLRQIGLEADIPDFDFPMGNIVYTTEHKKQLFDLVNQLEAVGL